MEESHGPEPRAKSGVRVPSDRFLPRDETINMALEMPLYPEGPWISVPPLPPAPSVDWKDPEQIRRWLEVTRSAFEDLLSLAHEGCLFHKHRVLSRAELMRQTDNTERKMRLLFTAADAGAKQA